MNAITQTYGLMVLAIALLVLEVFVPSGGLISILAGAALIASISVAFTYSVAFGTFQLALSAALIPAMIAMLIRWWPHSVMGRLILNIPPEGDERLSDPGNDPSLGMLIGRVGKARTKMLPSGAIRIDGKSYDAVTRGVAVEKGSFVEVVEVKGMTVVVVPIDAERARVAEAQRTPTKASQKETLETPIDELIADPFED